MRVGLENIKKIYGIRTVLDIGKLEFESGKIYAVLGPNGSGKTTLLRVISDMERADCGSVCLIGGGSVGSDMAYLPQKPYIFNMKVIENVALGLGRGRSSINKAAEALDCVGMGAFCRESARSLSGGEAQRVAVARTLVLGKGLVLLDEPASSVDIYSTRLIEEYIKAVNKRDRSTVIFTTHSLSQAVQLADEAVFLWEGRVLEKGEPRSVLDSPHSKEAKDFLLNWRI
jgi:ABC-type multidrug transport system ATPase subunit